VIVADHQLAQVEPVAEDEVNELLRGVVRECPRERQDSDVVHAGTRDRRELLGTAREE